MKQLTIRKKVTFWYAMIMVLMAASTLGLLLSVSETAHLSDQKSRLMETVEEAAKTFRRTEKMYLILLKTGFIFLFMIRRVHFFREIFLLIFRKIWNFQSNPYIR